MNIYYLTWLKNRIGKSCDELNHCDHIRTISELLDHLQTLSPSHKNTLSNRNVIYAEIDGSIVEHSHPVVKGMSISLFAPIVGG